MRQVTRDASRAFINGTPFKRGNTQVVVRDNGNVALLLHGNLIAVREQGRPLGETVLSLCGWNTPTTRERLNGLLELLGHPYLSFVQRNSGAYIQDCDGTKAEINPYNGYTAGLLVQILNAAN